MYRLHRLQSISVSWTVHGDKGFSVTRLLVSGSVTRFVKIFRCGFYKYNDMGSGITFLALNTNLYYKTNNTEPDICGQLEWLRSELENAALEQGRVIVFGHVPPGFFERDPFGPFFETSQGDHHYNEDYVQLVRQFSDVILAQIYGHTHTDTFRLFCGSQECSSGGYI